MTTKVPATSSRASTSGRDTVLDVVVRSVIGAGLVSLLYGAGYLSTIQLGWDDAMIRAFPAHPSTHVALVAITEEDFRRRDLFAATNPLDPHTLARLFDRLAAHAPAAVAVDILLDPPAYESPERRKSRVELYAGLRRIATSKPTQWVLIDPEVGGNVSDNPEVDAAWRDLRTVGSQLPRLHWAATTLKAETGLIRRVPLCSINDSGSTARPSLLGALAATVGPSPPCRVAQANSLAGQRLRFTGGFTANAANSASGRFFSAGELLGAPEPPLGGTILSGKLVIVGGTFAASRDTHRTPIGALYGAQIWAEAADSWWRRDAGYEPASPMVFLLQAAIGIVTGLLTLRFSTVLGHALVIAVFAVLAVLFSVLSFGLGFAVVSALPAFFAAQLNVRIASLPTLVAEYVQGRVSRRRRLRPGKGKRTDRLVRRKRTRDL